MDINLKDHTHFIIDYRSLPSGIGSIVFPNDNTILVTDQDCGPKDMSEASQQINEEFLPTSVSHIPFNTSEHWEVGQSALSTILEHHNVEYVYDSEMGYEFNNGNTTFTLNQWIEMRK
jgi:hypothetical protein